MNTAIAVVFILSLQVVYPLNCTNGVCFIAPENRSFAEQVIEVGQHYNKSDFTILMHPGNYTTTNGTFINFHNFQHVVIQKYPNESDPVNIMCPGVSHSIPNGAGFENSADILISNLNFMYCGPITSGLFFNKTNDIVIVNSSFHHNTDNGIQIILGNNITIRDCDFFSNVGTQPDNFSDLITDDHNLAEFRGAGLGIFFEDQEDIKVTIEGCRFKDNIAYKSADYNPDNETRPFGFIPFGNGGGIYMQLNRVHNAYVKVSNCNFTNNKAIFQGGALVMLPVNSNNTTLDVSQCRFIENRALGFSLSSQNDTVDILNVENFVNKINTEFSFNLDTQSLRNLTFGRLRSTGGFGGAISVNLFGTVEFNKLCIKDSYFSRNTAYAAGAIGLVVRDSLSKVKNGVDSNEVFIEK